MSDGGIILYTVPDGERVQLRAVDGTVWLTLSEIADLYATTSRNIVQIVRGVLDDGEVDAATTKREFVVRAEERYGQFDDESNHCEAVAADLADAESLRALEQKLGEHE